MKTKFLFLILSFFTISCTNKKNEDATPVQEEDTRFSVILKTVVKVDDDFCLFYTEDGTINFEENNMWQAVKGNENEQEVKFTLPKDVVPTQLRIDLGRNKSQEDIVLKSITLEYKGNNKVILGEELGILFRADDSKCVFDVKTGIIKGIDKEGQKQSPSLYPQEGNLGPALQKWLSEIK